MKYDIKKAVKEVIKQNKRVYKYQPMRFRRMTEDGKVENLEKVISDLVLDPEKRDKIITDLGKKVSRTFFSK